METRKIIGRQMYTLDMHLAGLPFEEFKRRAKDALLHSCLKLGDVEYLAVHFSTLQLSHAEAFREVSKYQRADGQYVFRGDFVSRETISDYVRKYGRVILLEGQMVTEV